MIILGIDPGYAILGYGVLESKPGQRPKPVDYGVIETAADEPFPQRLDKLYLGVRQLISLYKPEQVAFEELFFYRNVTTALQVGAGRGVALLAAQQAGLPLYEYTPMQIFSIFLCPAAGPGRRCAWPGPPRRVPARTRSGGGPAGGPAAV